MTQPFRFRGRFTKEPRRGVDADEQRQIQDFIARNGVKKLPAGWSQYGWQTFGNTVRFISSSPGAAFGMGNGRVQPRVYGR